MKVLELFAGSRSFSKVSEEFNYKTYTTDIEPFERIDQVCNIFKFDIDKMLNEFGKPDIIWASPPCTTFSVASISTHWTGGKRAYIPKTKEAEMGIQIIEETIQIIDMLKPKYFYIENPRGLLRKMPIITQEKYIRNTVWYCQYGDTRAKPTDLWTNINEGNVFINQGWIPKTCHRQDKIRDCHHEISPRGDKTSGTQGLTGSYNRSIVPRELCKELLNVLNKKEFNYINNKEKE